MDTTPDASTVMNYRIQASNLESGSSLLELQPQLLEGACQGQLPRYVPCLSRAYKEGELDDEVAHLVEMLRGLPAGYAFYTGGPGSGKTTTVLKSVRAQESETSNAAADDNWGAPAVTDNWQTSDTRADNKSNFSAFLPYELDPKRLRA
ncbi:hypothetical protein FPRO06_05553 [Fusarium proliferatum]|nr:hypothetical protein FPRO03_08626 [Fusarium proliferatum]KAG4274198.1 hypothetical protein FPRO04_01839 [Fusarium proliferatum]KAG4287901.1 hypothetical protein FPRO06_05553 [Fusarium proliferatum]CVL11370.1 uncharacterized protein FPRN_07780 [Fusarium proliferatum]